ncbi:helix-turn-helix domain-containing protein (plasmid) [Nocardioides sp. R1-1]|uniref:helix-turn-helix domain-containing protein n=1 Tax=Nocardioides sp. R1-1 TaxID=3383502 RepID=UPI0038CFA4A6
MHADNELIAFNTRRFRLERGMSLGELARRSGVSKQTLSKIEAGGGNPTIETLAALAGALDITTRRLLTQWGTPVFVQRQAEAEWQEGDGWSHRMLDEIYGSGYVRTVLLRLERTSDEDRVVDGHQPGTLHHLYVISGKLRTGPLTDTVDLSAGDFVRFPGDVPHANVCLSDRVIAHMVTTLPQVRQFRPPVRAS